MWAKEIEELKEEVRLLRQLLYRTVCVGEVSEVDETLCRVRVRLPDRDNMVTGWLSVLVPFSHSSYSYFLPKVGDTVLCVFLPFGQEEGFVVGSYYHTQEMPPVQDKNKFYKRFSDGTVIEYDEVSGTLSLRVQNSITKETKTLQIKASSGSSLDSPTFIINGDVLLQGNLFVSGNISSIGQTTAQGGLKTLPGGQAIFVDDLLNKYNTHTHTDSSGGTTSTPDQQLP